jgi:hypothetical protein
MVNWMKKKHNLQVLISDDDPYVAQKLDMILRCLTGIDYIVINCFYRNTKTIFNLCLGQPVATHRSFASIIVYHDTTS